MKFLVTGGCGFIGSHLVNMLVREGHKVVVVDDLSTGSINKLNPKVEFLEHSILLPIPTPLLQGVEGIFHLAAIASTQYCLDNWYHAHLVNQGGAVSIFEQASRYDIPVVYASSAAVYGNISASPVSEGGATEPVNSYGLDKLSSEKHAQIGKSLKNLNALGLRFFNVYGPGQRPDSVYAGVISIFAKELCKANSLNIYGEGLHVRDFIYVGDVAATLAESMHALISGKNLPPIMNVCTGKGTSVKELAEIMQAVWGVKVPLKYLPERRGDIRVSVGCDKLLRKTLTLPAFTEAEKGLQFLAESILKAA